MSQQLEKRLDGPYTRLLMRVQNINWNQHFTLEQTLEIISNLHLWSLPHQKRGRKPLSYPETLVSDNDNGIPELVNIIENRNHWK